jgi:hypothetical protein
VKSDRLHAKKVCTRRNSLGNGICPGIIVRDHLASSPCTVIDATRDQACLGNLELLLCMSDCNRREEELNKDVPI